MLGGVLQRPFAGCQESLLAQMSSLLCFLLVRRNGAGLRGSIYVYIYIHGYIYILPYTGHHHPFPHSLPTTSKFGAVKGFSMTRLLEPLSVPQGLIVAKDMVLKGGSTVCMSYSLNS